MKKSWLKPGLALIITLAMLLSVGCNNGAEKKGEQEGVKEKKVVLKLAGALPVTHYLSAAMDDMVKKVNEKSNGSIEIQFYPAGQLHTDKTMNDAILTGGIDIGLNSTAMWASVIPAMEIFDVPFLFPSYEKVKNVIDGGVGDLLNNEMEKIGVKALIWADYGFVQYANNVRPIKTPADFKGLKIRGYGELPSETIKALGAAPVTMSSGEMYMAVQRRTIDGLTSGTPAMYERKMHEVNKYLTITNHAFPEFLVAMNLESFNELSDAQKKVLEDVAAEITEEIRAKTKAEDERNLKLLQDNGMEVYVVPAEEIGKWVTATESVADIYIKRTGEIGQKIYDLCKSIK